MPLHSSILLILLKYGRVFIVIGGKVKKVHFSENEYLSIRTEMVERIKLLNSQSFTALASIVAFWSIGLNFKIELITKNIYADKIFNQVLLNFMGTVIFLIPLFLFLPLSIKSGENLRQIASISVYIRVFYDYPVEKNKDNRNWETSNNLMSDSNVNRGKRSKYLRMYNEEYTTLSVISFGIYVVFGVLQIHGLWELLEKERNMLICYHIIFILYIVISVVAIYVIYLIHTEASMKNSLMKNTENYVSGYIKRANYLGIIKDEDIEKAKEELDPMKNI